MPVIRTLIWSTTRLHSEGLAQLLAAEGTFEVTTTTSVDEIGDAEVDVVLVDLSGRGSDAAISAIANRVPGPPIVALSVPQDERLVVECVKAGVAAFLPGEATCEDLRRTVILAARGEASGPAWLMSMLLRCVATDVSQNGSAASTSLDRLTHREHEVLELLADGLSNKQIARRLYIELPTVKSHVHSILEKLEVSRRDEAGARLQAAAPNGRT